MKIKEVTYSNETGPVTASSSSNAIATASVNTNEKKITIEGISPGSATITVNVGETATHMPTSKSINVNVTGVLEKEDGFLTLNKYTADFGTEPSGTVITLNILSNSGPVSFSSSSLSLGANGNGTSSTIDNNAKTITITRIVSPEDEDKREEIEIDLYALETNQYKEVHKKFTIILDILQQQEPEITEPTIENEDILHLFNYTPMVILKDENGNEEIHAFGAQYKTTSDKNSTRDNRKLHSVYKNGSWETLDTDMPFVFTNGKAIKTDDHTVHLFGGVENEKLNTHETYYSNDNIGELYNLYVCHYIYNNITNTFTKSIDIPYNFSAVSGGSDAVLYNNKIHLLGAPYWVRTNINDSIDNYYDTYGDEHYSFNLSTNTWSKETNLPSNAFKDKSTFLMAYVKNNELNILSYTDRDTTKYPVYKYNYGTGCQMISFKLSNDGSSWIETTPENVKDQKSFEENNDNLVMIDNKNYIINRGGCFYKENNYYWDFEYYYNTVDSISNLTCTHNDNYIYIIGYSYGTNKSTYCIIPKSFISNIGTTTITLDCPPNITYDYTGAEIDLIKYNLINNYNNSMNYYSYNVTNYADLTKYFEVTGTTKAKNAGTYTFTVTPKQSNIQIRKYNYDTNQYYTTKEPQQLTFKIEPWADNPIRAGGHKYNRVYVGGTLPKDITISWEYFIPEDLPTNYIQIYFTDESVAKVTSIDYDREANNWHGRVTLHVTVYKLGSTGMKGETGTGKGQPIDHTNNWHPSGGSITTEFYSN